MTLQIVPLAEIPAFLAAGWRIVSRLERSPHRRWAVLMEKVS